MSTVVNGLLKANATVTVLTRDDTKAELQPLKEQGATLKKADYDDEASVKAALVGSEVVVCAIAPQHHAGQFLIARAAKAAGIQLFVPTEFGFRDEDGPNATKQKVRDLLKELDLPFALFHSGLWSEYLPFFFGYNIEGTDFSVIGEGNEKLSIVSRSDFSRFIAHALATAPKSSLEWARLSVEAGRASPREIAVHLENKWGKKLEIKTVDYEETKKSYDVNPVAYIQTRIADGTSITGTEEEVKNTIEKFFPNWNPSAWQNIIG
ncbi:putative pinoresinol-lariciresinol reductase 3 [Phytophthora citrophthora]|uniref:Pinoresinol-lariciresinol reductase 3 n=1 Tax=Phytophthora citrophthora TaxID=4793 RepID=A0AAD9GVG2_9STRA|nr:putative pinoresinol-lariciresinol reductase 3 [Phytophthora citrophthora]